MSETVINSRPVINITLPAKHMEIRLVRAPETYLLGSRGSFKTTRGIALYVVDMVYEMPRSTGVGVVLSYEHLDKNTFEPLLKGFADQGLFADEHYVVNKRPPDYWPKPYDFNGNEKYDRTITFDNGTVIKMVSLARKAAANAISAQWGFFDEVKFMDPEKDLKEIFPIFRGNEQYFGHSSSYLSKFFATDKLADPAEIEWLLNKRKLVDQNKVRDIIIVQNEVNKLRAQQSEATETAKIKLDRQIKPLEQILKEERADMVYVSEINCYDVLPFLGIKWLKAARQLCTSQRNWEVAYENKDPDKPGEAFYPAFSEEIHGYDTEKYEDIDLLAPLIIAMDYQHTVVPVPVAQIGKLPGQIEYSLNYIDYVYSLYPEGLKDAVKKFCRRFENHGNKKVFYVYDHTAIGKRTDADEYCEIVKKELIANKWAAVDVYTGQAPGHYQKYSDTTDWLEHKISNDDMEIADALRKALVMEIRVHKRRCAKLIKAIGRAPAKTSRGKTEKDKKYENKEKYPDLDQSETTHVTDAFDMINDAVLKQKMIKMSDEVVAFGIR